MAQRKIRPCGTRAVSQGKSRRHKADPGPVEKLDGKHYRPSEYGQEGYWSALRSVGHGYPPEKGRDHGTGSSYYRGQERNCVRRRRDPDSTGRHDQG